MSSRVPSSSRAMPPVAHLALPVICLVTADEDFHREIMTELLPWYRVVVRDNYENLPRWTKRAQAVATLIDIDSDGPEPHAGIAILSGLRKADAGMLLVSISRTRQRSVEKMAQTAGADLHFRSPVDLLELRQMLMEALRLRQEEAKRRAHQQLAGESSRFQDFIGASEPMRLVYDAIQQVADSSINVLVRGESGTGKELVARALVALSRRAKKPYIRLNCAALPENLIESELFGSEKGAFTGATESRPGQIELADQGTLFLDEVATLTLPLQTKLLRVLEDHQVQRLGGRTHKKIDFRLICATNEPLEEMARTGKFREDLYYRIHVVPIQLPPLRQRSGDIPLLCDHFLEIHCGANGIPLKRLAPDAMQIFEEHRWPGNVRELENLIQRLVITVRGEEIKASNLPAALLEHSYAAQEKILIPEEGTHFDEEVERLELALLTTALRRSQGGKTAAARLLGLDVQRMKYLCRKYSL